MGSRGMTSEAHTHAVDLDSPLCRKTLSKIRESTFLTIGQPLNPDDWKYLMEILAIADVSRVQHLVVDLPHWSGTYRKLHPARSYLEVYDLGTVLKDGGFSALQTLRINSSACSENGLVMSLHDWGGDESLTAALETGKFKNLHTLSLPTCNVHGLLGALTKGGISQLNSLIITKIKLSRPGMESEQSESEKLNAVLEGGYFKGLGHLDLSNGAIGGIYHGWNVFSGAIQSRLLPNLKCLRFGGIDLLEVQLENLAPLLCYESFNELTIDRCGITSEQVCDMVDAVLSVHGRRSSLKRLNLQGNSLKSDVVDALVKLAELGLEELDLSMNTEMDSRALECLMKHSREGHLPNLLRLNWGTNPISDEAAEAIAQASSANEALIVTIDSQVSDLSLKAELNQSRNRNMPLVARENVLDTGLKEELKALRDVEFRDKKMLKEFWGIEFGEIGDSVPLKNAKVFLCGFPRVGKTTLRKALLRYFGIRTKFVPERRPSFSKEPMTRGIKISHLEENNNNGQNMTLAVWDLAGQDEYHDLHGIFLADSGFAGGKATTFVLVFQAETVTDETEKKFLHWLRFVKSSSQKDVKRHVVVVLNRFDGKECNESDLKSWEALIQTFEKRFHDSLYIRESPFIFDVRLAKSVQEFKSYLFRRARKLLEDVRVPKACFQLQEELEVWSCGHNDKQLPIFSWQAFEKDMSLKYRKYDLSMEAWKDAASCLHEVGEVIYFDRKESTVPGSEHRSIVVVEPTWFFKEVVGRLLLPKGMQDGHGSVLVKANGSISTFRFKAFFDEVLVEGTRIEDVISMLEHMGLCYRKGEDEIIVPSLIKQDDYNSIEWERKGLHEVMGRCLATKDKERSGIPRILFRKLQVEIAQDRKFGDRDDSKYRVGRSFSSFKSSGLLVLIQFDVDHSDPTDDRIDILVKSEIPDDRTAVNLARFRCICEIIQKLEVLCAGCCPGLTYDIKVIKPWRAIDKTPEMTEREMLPLEEIKDRLIQGEIYTNWQLNGHQVELIGLLSNSELASVRELKNVTAKIDYDDCKRDALALGILNEYSLSEIENSEEEISNASHSGNSDGRLARLLHVVIQRTCHGGTMRRLGRLGETEEKSTKIEVLLKKLEAAVRKDDSLTDQHLSGTRHKRDLQIKIRQHSFAIQEQESSLPSFMFLSRKQGKSSIWISVSEALLLQSIFRLHFLCEAHFGDGSLHAVDGQEGIELKKNKLEKVLPWLRASLQVVLLVAQTVGAVYFPGLGNLVPNFQSIHGQELDKAVDNAATLLVEEGHKAHGAQDDHKIYGSATTPIDVKERSIAHGVIRDLREELGHGHFAKKTALIKVFLLDEHRPHVGSSEQAQSGAVVWICDDCYRKYGKSRAKNITT